MQNMWEYEFSVTLTFSYKDRIVDMREYNT